MEKHHLDPFGIGKWLMSHGFNSYVKLPEVIYVYMYIYILIYIYTERGDLERGDLHIVQYIYIYVYIYILPEAIYRSFTGDITIH